MNRTAIINAAVGAASSFPGFVANLERTSPDLARQFESKPLLYSKSVWGVMLTYAIGLLSTRLGLGLDEHTAELVTGVVLLVVTAALRAVTRRPIAGIVTVPAATEVAP